MSSVRYQGYPYVNPIVTDAPSLDPVTAAKWTNLPRRGVTSTLAGPSGAADSAEGPASSAGSSVPIPPKVDLDENPVVYIELPQADGSDVCQSIETEDVEPEYVQDTILYDPFENRRIVPKEEACSESSASDTYSQGSPSYIRPSRPNTLDLMSPGPSSSQSPHTSTMPGLPSFMEKEAFVYGGQDADGFPLSPIPMSEFPEPPPAYTEIAMSPTAQHPSHQTQGSQSSGFQTPIQTQPVPATTPPRTEVIVPTPNPGSPVGMMNHNRKFLTCHHCGSKVHTLVIRQTGHMTYIIYILICIFILPCFVIVFFMDCFKHKNHYCPNCNKLIGYVLPLCGKKMHVEF